MLKARGFFSKEDVHEKLTQQPGDAQIISGEIIYKPLEYPAWWECLCNPGSKARADSLCSDECLFFHLWFWVLCISLMFFSLFFFWCVGGGLETKYLSVTQVLYAWVTGPQQIAGTPRLLLASQVGNTSYLLSPFIAGKTKHCLCDPTGRRQLKACLCLFSLGLHRVSFLPLLILICILSL